MRVFIDANIYLSFIEISNEKMTALAELRKFILEKKISLIFPKITQEEVRRNFSEKIAKNKIKFNQFIPPKMQTPVSVSQKPIVEKIEKLRENYDNLLNDLKNDYDNSAQKILKEIENLISSAEMVEETEALIQKAYYRRLRGNPPGKRSGPIGDEIVWELLLNFYFDDDLTIIAADSDWKEFDGKDESSLKSFLFKEWKQKSKKSLKFYVTLGEYINSITKAEKVSKEEIQEEKQAAKRTEAYFTPNLAASYLDHDPDRPGMISTVHPTVNTLYPMVGTILPTTVASLNDLGSAVLRCSCGEPLDNPSMGWCEKCRKRLFDSGSAHV